MGQQKQDTDLVIPNGGLNEVEQPQKIKDNQWTAASNVEPMVDGARRRRGSAVENSVPLQKISLYAEAGTDTREFVDGTSEYIAQSFQPDTALAVRRVGFMLQIDSGTPSGDITCALVDDDGGSPGEPDLTSPVTNADFADWSSVDSLDLTDTEVWFHFTLDAAVNLVADTKYWFVLFHSEAQATGTDTASVAEDTSSGGLAPNAPSMPDLELWFVGDDVENGMTSPVDGGNTGVETLVESTGNYVPGWQERLGGTDGVVLHTAGGAAPVNGHAWVEQAATPCDLALSANGTVPSSLKFSGAFTFFCVYKPPPPAAGAVWMLGRKKTFVVENGIDVPKNNDPGNYGVSVIESGATARYAGASPQDTSTQDPLIMIVRRDNVGGITGYGTTDGGTATSFGTNSGVVGAVELDAIFRVDDGTDADAGTGLMELGVYPIKLTEDQTQFLYNGLAEKYGIAFDAGEFIGNVARSTDGTTWTDVPAADLNYRIYGEEAVITGIYDFQTTKGQQRHIVAADREVYKNEDGVMTAFSNSLRVGQADPNELDVGANDYFSFATGNDRLLISVAGGRIHSHQLYLDSNGNEFYHQEGLSRPVDPFSLATNTTDPFTQAGTNVYYVDYYLWNDDIGMPSNRAYNGVADTTNDVTVLGGTNGITVSSLPAAAVGSGQKYTHIRLELKEPGSSVFRLVKQIPKGVTSTTLGQGDLPTTIEGEYNHNAPILSGGFAKIRLVAENRQFAAHIIESASGNTILGYRLHYSAINGITPYYSSFPVTNYRDLGLGDNDYITNLSFMTPQTLIVGMKNALYAIDARRPGTSDKYTISSTEGIASHLSAVVIKSTLYFLSDSAQSRGFYRWRQGLSEPERLRGADRSLALMEPSRFQYASSVSAAVDADRNQWWTLLTSAGNTEHDTLFVYDVALDAWAVFSKASSRTLNVLGTVEESEIDLVFGGGYKGVEYKQDIGVTDAGVAYEGSFSTKWFDFGKLMSKLRMRGVDHVIQGETSGTLTSSLERDYGVETVETTIPLTPAGRDKIVSANNLRGLGQVFRFTFSGSTPWRLKAIAMDVQPTRKD